MVSAGESSRVRGLHFIPLSARDAPGLRAFLLRRFSHSERPDDLLSFREGGSTSRMPQEMGQ